MVRVGTVSRATESAEVPPLTQTGALALGAAGHEP
jgi:hypothetical protein